MSVLIPTKNGGPLLVRLLDALARQRVPFPFEVVVADSGSTDGTLEALARSSARVLSIPPESFNHGSTRNLLARRARGEYVVFLTQDAIPAHDDWLAALVAPLRGGEAEACYGRQQPRPDTDPINRFFLSEIYPPEGRVQALAPTGPSLESVHFSNAASAFRRDVLLRIPFRADIIMAEDQEWCVRALVAGYRIRYVAEARVEHAHHYRLGEVFRRYFDSGVSYREIFDQAGATGRFSRQFSARGVRHVARQVRHLIRTGHGRWVPRALLDGLVKGVAVFLGLHYRVIPRPLRSALSYHRYHWEGPTRPALGSSHDDAPVPTLTGR